MREIIVYADWVGLEKTQQLGVLRSQTSKGEEIFSFEYQRDWLNSDFAASIDPDLQLFTGPQYLSGDKPNFGLFLDSSPDRWGRVLMQRREALYSQKKNLPPKRLAESDFLLGVNDETRMGGLRFKEDVEGPFLSNDPQFQAPPFTSIRELEQASLRYEDEDFFTDRDAEKWLKMLLSPGSSLGGARPKASVVDPKGNLWIAKFPSRSDASDIGAWEAVVNRMAHDLGIDVAIGEARMFSQKQHSYLSKRFDRNRENRRIHFASAMTLLGHKDGYNHKEGGSYLELVELLEYYGTRAHEDIRQLWKRIVFSVAVSNTDDHLRNHGFLLGPQGWQLSPAYDINPAPDGFGLSLNISEESNSLDFDLCMSVIDYFRWKDVEAKAFIEETKSIVSTWQARARSLGIPKAEQTMMAPAFRYL